MSKSCARWSKGKSFTLAEQTYPANSARKPYMPRGKKINICDFLDVNREGLAPSEIREIHMLQRGGSIGIGGGAAAFFRLKRVR